jgi:hypothetical protein
VAIAKIESWDNDWVAIADPFRQMILPGILSAILVQVPGALSAVPLQ